MRNEMQTEGTEAMLDLRTGKETVADCLGDTCCGRKGSELRRRNSDTIMSNKGDGPTVRWLCWGVGVKLRATRAPREHVACWEYTGRHYFEHTSMLPVGGHLSDQTLLSPPILLLLWKDLCIPLTPADLKQNGTCTKPIV